jgi:glycosyltransferase involved in cell wall biosynthesis
LIATSPIVAREVAEVAGRAPQIVPYWITLPATETVDARVHSAIHLLAVGRLIERKGYEYLIRALPLLPPELDARITIVGKGQERERLQALSRDLGIESRVEWIDYASDAELARLYSSCSIFVHASIVDRTGDTESVGMVLLEAMSHARPIVATNVGGIPDVIRDGVTGLLVPEKNPHALADAIARLARDPELARRLGAAARADIQAQADWDKSVDQIVRIYAGESAV